MAVVNEDEVTRRLLDEGACLLAEDGSAGLSLRKVAARAGTSTMAVYTRFGDKDALLAAMRREGFRRLGDQLTSPQVRAAADPLTRLGEVGRGYRAAALASPALYGLMFGPLPSGLAIGPDDAAAAEATFRPLRDGVQSAVDAGLLRGDPERIAQHLWAVVHGAVGLELAGQARPADADEHYEQTLFLAAAPFLTQDG